MEWNMEENFSMEWNGRFLVWNGRKLPVWNTEKSSSIPYNALTMGYFLKIFVIFGKNSYFNAIWITFCTFYTHLKELNV